MTGLVVESCFFRKNFASRSFISYGKAGTELTDKPQGSLFLWNEKLTKFEWHPPRSSWFLWNQGNRFLALLLEFNKMQQSELDPNFNNTKSSVTMQWSQVVWATAKNLHLFPLLTYLVFKPETSQDIDLHCIQATADDANSSHFPPTDGTVNNRALSSPLSFPVQGKKRKWWRKITST